MMLHDRVRLKTFNGAIRPDKAVTHEENYWRLIGKEGVVIETAYTFSEQERVLVRFDSSVSNLGLACHNQQPNALWILMSDLEKI